MQSMTEKKKELEAACANAVKTKDFAAAAKAATEVADCAEILASRTEGVVRGIVDGRKTDKRELGAMMTKLGGISNE